MKVRLPRFVQDSDRADFVPRDSEGYLHIPVVRIVLGIIIFWSLLTCWFVPSKDENSVVLRLGHHVRTAGPGLHFKAPWPIEDATEVSVTTTRKLEIGYRTQKSKDENNEPKETGVAEEYEMLTQDTNIVHLDFVIQYKVSDAAKWLFKVRDPDEAVKLNGLSAMRTVTGGQPFDTIATSGRAQVQHEAEDLLRELCDRMDFGAQIVSIQLQDAHPPDQVMAAFKDVSNALEDKQKAIREAEGYKGQQIPQARGEAQKKIEEANGYKAQRINWANGDASRFSQVLVQYQQNKELTTQRMRFESLEYNLAGKEQIVIGNNNSNLLKFLDLKK